MQDDDVNPGDNLFITGLSIRTANADLEDIFSKYGKVIKAEIMVDPHTRESRGFGFIRMATAEDADRALNGVTGTEIDGRMVTVEKAKRSRPRTPTPGRYYGPPKRGQIIDLLVVNLDMIVIMTDIIWIVMILPDMIVTKETVMIAMIAMIGTTATTIAMIVMTVVPHHQDMILTLLVPDHLIKEKGEK
ncbi:uncharacterized protein BX663DRAFT_5520 [Cokeromyces recurvatus]|uniref:uncharacterized protein n=1 Tax=Cokeromyces recurvatus TaxID=90255 RepID=UPI00221F2E8F|nr:uncharacterized protein BX663DRAFT_5520 [Cokeromyces recurvatus]KAI7907610.1 hypothetical protein BX663DRAFT_5520 [Cokeromyces recurvatus]